VSDALKDALALLPSVVCASVVFVASFAISGELWFNLAAGAGVFALSMWFLLRHSRSRIAITLAATICLIAAVLAPTILDRLQTKPAPAPDDLVHQIAGVAIPIRTVDAGSGFADLEPLQQIWKGTRVVALGEATHGTSEFFRMKHRLTEFLVTQMGFRHFAMELDPDSANEIEAYIQGRISNNPVIKLSWPWQTVEVAAMVDWMRKYNQPATTTDRLHFHGIDYQGDRRDFRMARNTLDLLNDLGPEDRVILWAHNAHISRETGWMGSYLKSSLQNQIYLTGFEFDRGRFTSRMEWIRTYTAEPADSRFYADALNRTGAPLLFLDFRTMMAIPTLDAWLNQPHLAHHLQEAHGLLRLRPGWVRDDESWPSLYDGVVYIDQSTPARQM